MAYSTTDGYESRTVKGRAASTTLHGMKAICAYMGKSESTILKYIKNEGLPAAKIGGEWVSDRDLVDEWRMQAIVAGRSCKSESEVL
jgi:hypothetical protein